MKSENSSKKAVCAAFFLYLTEENGIDLLNAVFKTAYTKVVDSTKNLLPEGENEKRVQKFFMLLTEASVRHAMGIEQHVYVLSPDAQVIGSCALVAFYATEEVGDQFALQIAFDSFFSSVHGQCALHEQSVSSEKCIEYLKQALFLAVSEEV